MTAPTPQDAARSAARRFCGWHVTPVLEDDEVTIDGPGSLLLVLPTLRLVELSGVVEDGVALDVETDLYVSTRGLVRKRSGAYWSHQYGAITVTMTHGFTDDPEELLNACDFNAAVSSHAARGGAQRKRVGPVEWFPEAMDAGSAFSVAERSLLEQYRLESAP